MITKSGYATKKSNVTQEKVNSYRQLLNEPAQEETSTPVVQEQVKPVNIRDLSVSNVLPKPKVNISAGEVKPLNMRNFVNEINNTPEAKRANLTVQTDSLKKQINTKEQEYARANNISDWNTKRQEQSRIQQELNALRKQLDSKNKDLVMLGGYNLLSGEQVKQFNKNAPLTQKIDKALKYDIPTTAKKVGRTAMDLAMQIPTAAYDVYEGALDATVATVGALGSTIADKTGNKDIANKIREGATKFVNITPSSKPLVEEAKNKGEGIYEPKVLGIKVRDALYSISNMITAAYSGGLPMMALSASGQNIEEALTDNQSLERAVAYGDISGAIEGLTEKMFDAVKIVGGGKFDKFLPKSAIGKLIGGSAGEGIEEIISNGLNPFVKQLTYEKGTYDLPDFYEYIKMLGESFWNGAVIGAIMKGGQDISTPQFREQYKQDVYTAVDKSKLPNDIKETVKQAMITPAQQAINQDLETLRSTGAYQRTQTPTNTLPKFSEIVGKKNADAQLARTNQLALPEGGKFYATEQGEVIKPDNYVVQQETKVPQEPNYSPVNARQVLSYIQIPTAKTSKIHNTAKELNVDVKLANRVMDMAKLTEVPVNGFVDVNPKIDGYYKDGAIYINKNSEKAQDRIFVHELTHNIEKADGWQGLRDTIFNSNVLYNELAEKGQTLEEYRQLIKDTYAENEIQLNEDDIDREVIAKFAEEHLLKDQKSIDRMVQENPTFMQRVKNFIDDLVVKFKGTAEEKELLRIQRMYDKAFAESKQVETSKTKKVQYGINDTVPKGYTRLYRGLNQEFDRNYDKKKIDNVNGYESWTDNYDLAKEYGDNVYYIDIPTSEIKDSIIDENPQSETYGDRNLMYVHDKKVGLKGESGKEYMLYTDHDNYANVEYKKADPPSEKSYSINTDNQGRQLSKQQQEYFKDSKVRDEQGRLLEVYHGTDTGGFMVFNPKGASGYRFGDNIVNFFTNNQQMAETYTEDKGVVKTSKVPESETQIQQYLNNIEEEWGNTVSLEKTSNGYKLTTDDGYETLGSYKNLNELSDNYKRDIENYFGFGDTFGGLYKVYLNIKNPLIVEGNGNMWSNLYNPITEERARTTNEIIQSAIDAGEYDGVIFRNINDYGWKTTTDTEVSSTNDVYVTIKDSNQIKAVDNLNPTENEDIRYSVETRGQATVPKKPTVVDNIAPKTEQNIDDLPQETQKVARVLTKAPKKDLDLSFETVSDMLMRKIVDAGNTINTIGKLSNDETLYPMYNNTKQARQSAEYMIGEKQTDITGTKIVGNSLVEIFKPVKAKGEEYTGKFYEYLLHMHNIDRMAQDKPVFGESVTAEISRQKADELLKENPEFEKLANKVYVYNRNLMQWRVDSGLISQEQSDIMNKMYPHYVPTFRDMSGTAGSKIVGNAVNIANTVRKATGGNRDILPLDLAMARQTMQTVQAAKRNLFGNRLLNDVLANKERAAKYITAIEKSEDGLDVDEQSDASLSQPNNNTNVFKIYRDGKSFNMYVNSGIFEGLRAISSQVDATDTNKLLNALSKPNTMFKQLVTGMNPMFLIKNPIRDIQDATLYSKNLRKFLNNYPKTFKEQLENSADWQLYKALGGVGSSFFDYETGIDKTLNKSKLQRLSDNTLGRIEELNMMTEQAPRFAEFKATIERAGNRDYDTLMKAIYNAADVTVNFGRTGTITQVLNKTIVPFLNPSIQGADKLIRTLATTKGGSEWAKLVTKATLFGILPSVLNELIFGDDEEYENLNDRDKDTNFVFKYGDNKWIKIPKGRVISSLGNLANRGIRLAKGQEVNWGDYISTLADQTAPISPFESNIVSPIMAVKNNKSWYGSDIVPQRLQQYEAKDQYDEKTDAFSKWLGGILNYSPKKINYLIDAYTGVIGDFALPLTTPTAEVNPFMKAFTIDGNFSNEIGNKFYETKDKYSKYKNNKPSAVVVSRYLNKQNDMVNDLHAEIRKIQSSDASDAEKKAKSGELRELINLIESTAIMNVKEYEKAVEKYINKFPNNKERSEDYAYLMANKEMFGAEYAVKAYSTKKYNDNRKKNMNTVFNEIIKNYSKVKTPVAEQEKETLPTASDIPRKIK